MRKLIDAVAVSFILIACTAHVLAQDDKDDLDYKALHLALDKAASIYIDHIDCQRLPLSDFLDLLQKKAKEQDPEHKGVSISLDLTKAHSKPLEVAGLFLDDISVSQVLNIVYSQTGLQMVFKDGSIHLTDSPVKIAPLVDSSPELHKIIDKINKDAYDKCEILCRNATMFYEQQITPKVLKECYASQYVLRDYQVKGDGFLDFLHGLKVVGRRDGDDLDCYYVIIFYNKDGTTDEIDLALGNEGSWKGRKLEVSSEAKKALKQIITGLSPG